MATDTSTTLPNGAQASLPGANGNETVQSWLAAWIAIILIIVLFARTKWGQPIVYYILWLAVAILVLTHASDLASIISGGKQP